MIYSFFNTIIKGYLKYRYTRVESMYAQPSAMQNTILVKLLNNLSQTKYGKNNDAIGIKTYKEFVQKLPLTEYEQLFDYIQATMDGNENVLWPGKTQWFAKSSGTTNDRSKYIPITDQNLFENHVAASWDAVSILYNNRPDSKIFENKNLIMGGSLTTTAQGITIGDVSAILLQRMPMVGRPFYSPDFETALLADWETKIERMVDICINDDITMFAGVPTWTIVLFNRILEKSGKKSMHEVWPNVRTYMHGGVGFDPYVSQFKEYFPGNTLDYYEVYNASEGYFAVQDRKGEKGMLLLLDNDIFYEFLPVNDSHNPNADTLLLQDVELHTDYCLVITTSSGLWRYKPGDVIQFVSLNPYRIIVSGRTKQYINVFGEELMVANAEAALSLTCRNCDTSIADYTVAPIFIGDSQKGGHEWLVEFSKEPKDIQYFAETLDQNIRAVNSDYDAKRTKDLALERLKLTVATPGTFHRWLRSKGKIGGQTKIPRLSNDRKHIEELRRFIQ